MQATILGLGLPPIMENQMQKKMDNETGNWWYIVNYWPLVSSE